MSVFDKWKKSKNGEPKQKAKKMRLTRRDIQQNLIVIDELMSNVQTEICEITREMANLDLLTESGKERYTELREQLNDKNEIYSGFQQQQKRNIELLEGLNKSGRVDTVVKVISVTLTGVIGVIALLLNRENPSALKVASYIGKLFGPPRTTI